VCIGLRDASQDAELSHQLTSRDPHHRRRTVRAQSGAAGTYPLSPSTAAAAAAAASNFKCQHRTSLTWLAGRRRASHNERTLPCNHCRPRRQHIMMRPLARRMFGQFLCRPSYRREEKCAGRQQIDQVEFKPYRVCMC